MRVASRPTDPRRVYLTHAKLMPVDARFTDRYTEYVARAVRTAKIYKG